MSQQRAYWFWTMVFVLVSLRIGLAGTNELHTFVKKNCFQCHDADTKKGGLDLTALPLDLKSRALFARWVKVDDRVTAGEMPPPKKKTRPAPAELKTFTNSLTTLLLTVDRERIATEGRAIQRRLNRYEYEDTLRD